MLTDAHRRLARASRCLGDRAKAPRVLPPCYARDDVTVTCHGHHGKPPVPTGSPQVKAARSSQVNADAGPLTPQPTPVTRLRTRGVLLRPCASTPLDFGRTQAGSSVHAAEG